MGLGSSKESGGLDAPNAYAQYLNCVMAGLPADDHENLVRGGGGGGGGGGCVGGLDDLKDYGTTVMSRAKRQLIMDIASDLATRLKISSVNPKGKTLDQVITALRQEIPDPRQGKGNDKRMTSNKKFQEQTCRVIGQVINDRMGTEVINVNDPPATICDQVGEIMYSLFTGIHGEFVSVRKDVKRLMDNLDVLQQLLEKNFSGLEGKLGRIQQEEDVSIVGPTKALTKFHKDLLGELKRQRTLLAGMTDSVIKKSDQDLSELLKESGEFKTIVKGIKSVPGSDKFSEKLAAVLSGVRTVAEAANEVEKALSKLGISRDEYAKLKKPKDLKKYISGRIAQKLDASEGMLGDYMKAAKVIYNHQYMHDDLVKSLGSKRGSSEGAYDGGAYDGGAYDGGAVTGGLKLDKRVRKREELRRDLLSAFNQQMGSLYNDMSGAIKAVAAAIGAKKVDLSDEMEEFIRALELLPDIGKRYTYFALTGYLDDIRAKEERERFLASAKYLLDVTESLSKKGVVSGIASVNDLKKSLQGLVDLVGKYYKRFSEGFGVMEPEVRKTKGADVEGAGTASDMAARLAAKAAAKASEVAHNPEFRASLKATGKSLARSAEKSFLGSAEGGSGGSGGSGVTGGLGDSEMIYGQPFKMSQVNRVAYDFNAAKDTLIYDFRTAKIRSTLLKLPAERASFSENYTRVVGDAIADSVDKVNGDRETFNNSLNDGQPIQLAFAAAIPGADQAKKHLGEFRKLKNEMFDAKIDMYRTAEALEHYMNAFSDGIAAHPDDLQDVVGMLNSVEIISKWQNEESGDAVTRVFEVFPGSYVGYGPKWSNLNNSANYGRNEAGGHYYTKVMNVCRLTGATGAGGMAPPANYPVADPIDDGAAQNPGLPGNPFLAVPTSKIADAYEGHTARDVLKHMEKALAVNPLKNVVSIFINVGAKFGGAELIKKSHLSAIQIYRNLLNYIKYSSLSMGVTHKAPAARESPAGAAVAIDAPFYNLGFDLDPAVNAQHIGDNDNTYKAGAGGASPAVQLGPTGNMAFNARELAGQALGAPAAPGTLLTTMTDIANANVSRVRYESYVALAGVGRTELNSAMDFDFWRETDQLFQMSVKAMVSKVLTAIGVFNMFNRPINEDGLGFFSGLRLVIGGAGGSSVPQVIPEALELYIRLPLLAEFYRKIFNFDQLNAPDFRAISLVPEMSGTFSGLINIIFNRAKYVTDGNYGDADMRSLIEEINKIWARFRSSKNPVNEVLDEFIAEVNRRYGILKSEERSSYLNEQRDKYKDRYGVSTNPEEVVDFELAGMDEDDDYSRPAPSQTYQTKFATAGQANQHKYNLDLSTHESMLRDLRMAIDKMFAVAKKQQQKSFPDNVRNAPISFGNTIRTRKHELKSASTPEEKYQVVVNAINSFGANALTALDRNLIMFHETVVSNLTVLNAVQQELKQFKQKTAELSGAVDAVNLLASYIKKNSLASPDETAFQQMANFTAARGVDINADPYYHGKTYTTGRVNGANAMTGNEVMVMADRQDNNRANITWNELNQFVVAGLTAQNPVLSEQDRVALGNVFRRFALDQTAIVKNLFELLYVHSRDFDKLVDLNIDALRDQDDLLCSINVSLSHSKLIEECKTLLSHTKEQIDKFRGLLPKTLIDRFEKYEANNADATTIFNIEKCLIDDVIFGRVEGEPEKQYPLERTTEKLNKVFNYLTEAWRFNADSIMANVANLAAAVAPVAAATVAITAIAPYALTPADQVLVNAAALDIKTWLDARYSGDAANEMRVRTQAPGGGNNWVAAPAGGEKVEKFSRQQFSYVINQLTYYTAASNNGAVGIQLNNPAPGVAQAAQNDAALDRTGLWKLLSNTSGVTKSGTAAGQPWPDAAGNHWTWLYNRDMEAWDFDKVLAGQQKISIWINFNRLVATYLKSVYDGSLEKVYNTTIDKFANGAFSSAIFNRKWFDDVGDCVANNDYRKTNNILSAVNAGQGGGVLLKTLAIALRQLVSEPSSPSPAGPGKQYLVTDLAEVPLYMKERMRANLPVLRKMANLLALRCDLLQKFAHGLNLAQPVDIPNSGAAGAARTNKEMTVAVSSVLDEINRGCKALATCVDETMAELNDDPKFMELRDNFIEEYKAANGRYPFMPASTLTYFIKRAYPDAAGIAADPGALTVLRPIRKPGDDNFKMLYGARGIINSDPSLKQFPGMLHILKAHNESTDARHEIKESDLEKSLQTNLRLLRFVLNGLRYKDMFTTQYSYAPNVNTVPDETRSTLQSLTGTSLSKTIELTESAFQKDQRIAVSTHVQRIQDCEDYSSMSREAVMVYNIIDMNKVPINFAALMKEMPMVNLLNYSYTFDRMVMDMLGLDKDDVDAITKSNEPYSITMAKLQGGAGQGYPGPGNADSMAARLLGLMLMFPYDEVERSVYLTQVSRIIRGDMGIEGLGRPAYLGDELYNKALFGEVYPAAGYREEAGPRTVNPRMKPTRQQIMNEPVRDTLDAIIGAHAPIGGGRVVTREDIIKIMFQAAERTNPIQTQVQIATAIQNEVVRISGAVWAAGAIDARRDALSGIVHGVFSEYHANATGVYPTTDTIDYQLHYMDKDGQVQGADFGQYKELVQAIGRMRFDTKFTRNLFWITNIQRVLRLRLRKDLFWFDSKIVSEHAVLAPMITEQFGNASGPIAKRFMK